MIPNGTTRGVVGEWVSDWQTEGIRTDGEVIRRQVEHLASGEGKERILSTLARRTTSSWIKKGIREN